MDMHYVHFFNLSLSLSLSLSLAFSQTTFNRRELVLQRDEQIKNLHARKKTEKIGDIVPI